MTPTQRTAPAPQRRGTMLRSFAGEGLRMALLSLASLALGYLLTLAYRAWFGIPSEAAFGYAVLTCSVVNFFGCRHYVFRGRKGPLWQEAAKFFPSVLAFRAIEVVLFALIGGAIRALSCSKLVFAVTADQRPHNPGCRCSNRRLS